MLNLKVRVGMLLWCLVINTAYAYSPCEINFVKYIKGELPANIKKNPTINMWAAEYDTSALVQKMKKMKGEGERYAYINELTKLVSKEKIYAENISAVATNLYKQKLLSTTEVRSLFQKKHFEHMTFFVSKESREIRVQMSIDPIKKRAVEVLVKGAALSKSIGQKYKIILMQSNITPQEIKAAKDAGMILRGDLESIERFKHYIDFLDQNKPKARAEGLKNIEKIYAQGVTAPKIPVDMFYKPHNQFLAQLDRIKQFEKRRIYELERIYKLQQKNDLIKEIDDVAMRDANGLKVRIEEKLRLKKNIDDMPLAASLKKRAIIQANQEAGIFRKMINSCSSGSSPRLHSAAKKFARFKFALALGSTPFFYIMKNEDKMDKDQYFWEKLGHEMVMGIAFTFVGNKLFTNSKTSFFQKYIEGFWKFGALSYAEAYSYDELFGPKSMMRHIQKLYKNDVPPSQIENELEGFKNSPTFQKDVEELVAYLEEKHKLNNTKNFFEKYFNFGAYNSLDDNYKITQEDLESEEAREVMMELIAERIYLQGMGNWPIFQTGGKDTDRWAFYRGRNLVWDLKGLALNLTIFQMMCREPFGKVGSWVAILGLVVGDSYLSGDLTYQYRRDAINQ